MREVKGKREKVERSEAPTFRRSRHTSALCPLPFTFARKRGGFTIIELLVVLAVIGLLVSLAFVQFSAARAKTRDTKREKDIKTLQDALSIYVTNAKTYPTTDASGLYLTGSDTVSTALVASGAIAAIPADPQNTGNFRYHYVSVDGFSYTLTYYLETNTIPGKSAGVQTAGP